MPTIAHSPRRSRLMTFLLSVFTLKLERESQAQFSSSNIVQPGMPGNASAHPFPRAGLADLLRLTEHTDTDSYFRANDAVQPTVPDPSDPHAADLVRDRAYRRARILYEAAAVLNGSKRPDNCKGANSIHGVLTGAVHNLHGLGAEMFQITAPLAQAYIDVSVVASSLLEALGTATDKPDTHMAMSTWIYANSATDKLAPEAEVKLTLSMMMCDAAHRLGDVACG